MSTSMDPNPQVKLPESGHSSVRSTKSLSIFVNPETPQTMARSEEVTISMYADSPTDASPTAAGHSKRRHREATDQTAVKESRKSENTSTSKTGFFKFMKKKKSSETKSNNSSTTTVKTTSTPINTDRNDGLATEQENSLNHRTELEVTSSNADTAVAASSLQPTSTQGEQIKTDKTSEAVKSAELKSSTSAENRVSVVTHTSGSGQPSAVLNDSNNNTASTTITVGSSTQSAAKTGSREKSEEEVKWRKKPARSQQDDEKNERVVHSLPSYSAADVDLSSSAVRDKNVRAKFAEMLGGQDSGGSGLSSPASGRDSANQSKKTYLRRDDPNSTAVAGDDTSEVGSATNMAQREDLVSSPAIERMAEMQSTVAVGQVPKVISKLSADLPSTENREYIADSSTDDLSLQEDVTIEATIYYGQDQLTPPANKSAARRESTTSGEDRNSTPTPPAVQDNKAVVTKVSTVPGVHLERSSDHKTAPKSGNEIQTSQQALKTNSRSEEHSTATTTKTTYAVQERRDAATKVSSAQNVQLKTSYSPDKPTVSTAFTDNRAKTSDQTGRSNSDKDVEKRLQQKRAQTEDKRNVHDGNVVSKIQTTGVNSIRVERSPDRPDVRSRERDRSRSSSDSDKEQRAQKTRRELEEDRDSTPTPTRNRTTTEQERAGQARSTKVHVVRRRSKSPGAHGVELGPTERHQKTLDQCDAAESVSEVEQRQHDLKAKTQAELLAKRKYTTVDSASGDHDVRTEAKSTYTVTMNTHASQRGSNNVERVPSKASLDQRQEHAAKYINLRDGSKDQMGDMQHRSIVVSGRPARVEVNHQQPTMEGYRDESINLEWRDPQHSSQDAAELRSHMRPREHRVPARTQSNTSSDISSSTVSRSSVDHADEPNPRPGSRSSSDATPTEADNVRPYRGRKTVPGSREAIRRSTSLPMSDEVDAAGDFTVSEFSDRRGYHLAPVVEIRQQNEARYAGRSAAPVSGRQKIKRTTETPENYDESGIRSEPRSGRIYVGYDDDLHMSNAEVYERAQRQRQTPSGRSHLNHNVDIRDLSSSPDDLDVSPQQLYADRRTVTTNGYMEYDDDPDVAARHRSQRHAPTGRTGKIPRSGDVDIRVMNSSPDSRRSSEQLYTARRTLPADDDREYDDDPEVAARHRSQRHVPTGRTGKMPRSGEVDIRVKGSSPDRRRTVVTPTSIDDRPYQNVEATVSSTRRAPTGRTGRIDHGSNVDVNIFNGSPTSMHPISTRPTSDGHRTPASAIDWPRHQHPGQLTVDVIGQDRNSLSLRRVYRSMPDLLEDGGYIDDEEIVPKRKPRNYSGYYEDDNGDQAGDPQPRSSNPGGFTGGRVTATIRDTVVELRNREQVDGQYRPRSFSSSGMDRGGGSAGGSGRKRGFITRATVENRGGRGRRSGRTNDMPMTDVEDFNDNDVGRRKSGGSDRPSHVARIYVGGVDDDVGWESQDDVLSVFSEPPQLGRPRSSNTLRPSSVTPHAQSRPSAVLTPAHGPASTLMPPTMPVLELAHVDTQIHDQLSPDVGSPEATISAVDPALRGASKQGTNYHITLTLKPTITTTSPRQGTMTSRSHVHDQYARTWSQPPRSVSAMAVYANDNPSRTTPQPHDRPSPRRPMTSPTTRPGHGTPTTVPAPRPRSRPGSATDGQIGFDVEVRSISDDDQVVHTSVSRSQTNVTKYDPGPQISSTVEFTYSPPHEVEEPVGFRRAPPTRAPPHRDDDEPLDYRRVPPTRAPPHRDDDEPLDYRRVPPTRAPVSPPGGRRRRPQNAEDDVTRSHRPPNQQKKQNLPEVQRGTFLIKNSIDTARPPKVRITLHTSRNFGDTAITGDARFFRVEDPAGRGAV